jgi:hypothetical protein
MMAEAVKAVVYDSSNLKSEAFHALYAQNKRHPIGLVKRKLKL